MKLILKIILLTLISFDAYSNEYLQMKEILYSKKTFVGYDCIYNESFKPTGKSGLNLYTHTVTFGHFYDSKKCNPSSSNAFLYRKTNEGYLELWEHGEEDPAVSVSLNIVQHNDIQILVYDHSDGGSGGFSYQEAYVVDGNYKVPGVIESPVYKWAEAQLLAGQRLSGRGSIVYMANSITYSESVVNANDNSRWPTGGSLAADLAIESVDSYYKIKVLKTHNKKKKLANAIYFNNQGLKYYKKKQYSNAETHFKKAVKKKPTYWQAWNNLALVLYKQKKYKKSLDASNKVISKSFNKPINELASAYFNKAMVYEKEGKLKEALTEYEYAHQIEINSMSVNKSNNRLLAIERVKKLLNSAYISPYTEQGNINIDNLVSYDMSFTKKGPVLYATNNIKEGKSRLNNDDIKITSWKIINQNSNNIELSVNYIYKSHHKAYISVEPLGYDKMRHRYVWRPSKIKASLNTAMLKLSFKNGSPNKTCTNQLRFNVYGKTIPSYFIKTVPFKKCWISD